MMPAWERILVHHSAGKDLATMQYDDIDDYHEINRGWSDIGYHRVTELVESDYVTIHARPLWRPGAHCRGQNNTAVGWCFVGNFMQEPPPTDQLIEGARSMAELILILNLDRDLDRSIQMHKEHWPTKCPGAQFPIDRLKGLVAGILKLGE